MRLAVDGVCWSAAGRPIISDVTFVAEPGRFLGLIGPNGSGKTTLLRCIYRALRPSAGTISLDGRDVWASSAREVARVMAAVLQETVSEAGYTVWEVVQMGRTPHKRLTERLGRADDDIVGHALAEVSASELADRDFSTLSGGEKQRVLLARSLAQQPRVLVLDEPTNHLDIRFQLDILAIVGRIGVTAVAALHDLNLAAAYCDGIVVLHEGRMIAAGPPAELLTSELVARVYGVEAEVALHPRTGQVTVTYLPAHRGTSAPGALPAARSTAAGLNGPPTARRSSRRRRRSAGR